MKHSRNFFREIKSSKWSDFFSIDLKLSWLPHYVTFKTTWVSRAIGGHGTKHNHLPKTSCWLVDCASVQTTKLPYAARIRFIYQNETPSVCVLKTVLDPRGQGGWIEGSARGQTRRIESTSFWWYLDFLAGFPNHRLLNHLTFHILG